MELNENKDSLSVMSETDMEKDVKYHEGIKAYHAGDFQTALNIFREIGDYSDAKTFVDRCSKEIYNINKAKEDKRNRILTILQVVAYSLPVILSVIFGIILFSNQTQITIVSDFIAWCTWWVIFLIFSIISSSILFYNRFKSLGWDAEDKAPNVCAIVYAVIMLIASLIVFPSAGTLTPNFNPANNIEIEATSVNYSTSYSTYYTKIYYTIENKGNIEVTGFVGEMRFYDGEEEISFRTVRFTGSYKQGNSYNVSVQFDENNSTPLYDTPFDDLRITFKVTKMEFASHYDTFSFDGKVMTIKEAKPINTQNPDYIALNSLDIEAIGVSHTTSYDTYKTKFLYIVKNDSNKNIDRIEGEMYFYDGAEKVGTCNVNFNGPYTAGEFYDTTVEFTEQSYDCPLYYVPFDNLKITYKITKMRYVGGSLFNVKSDLKTLKEAKSNAGYSVTELSLANNIEMNVTSADYSMVGSTSYTTVSITLKNNCIEDVTYIEGEMCFYDGNTKIASWNVYFDDTLEEGELTNVTVEFDESYPAPLYNVPFENLRITYKITKMQFYNFSGVFEFDGKLMTIKEPSN